MHIRSIAAQATVLLVILSTFALSLLVLPIKTAMEIGPDEHYELMLGLLCSHGFIPYQEIWDDQPPLLTLLLSRLFVHFGPTIVGARLLIVTFGLLLFILYYSIIRKRLAVAGSLIAVLCLMSSPPMLQLSVSVMKEVPAMAIGLLSVWLLLKWESDRRLLWLLGSAVILALSFHVKFTAAIFVPALCIEIVRIQLTRDDPVSISRTLCAIGMYTAAGTVAFAILASVLWQGDYQSLWRSHLTVKSPPLMYPDQSYRFSLGSLVSNHPMGVAGAIVCLILLPWSREYQRYSLPLVLLGTVAIVHSLHWPWWYYYNVHFALPLCWFAGYAADSLVFKACRRLSFVGTRQRLVALLACLIGSLAVVALSMSEGRLLRDEITEICQRPRIADSSVLLKMREYSKKTHWLYTRSTIFGFHANLLVPPEIGILPLKRLWSQQITEDQVVAYVKRYRPEQLLLAGELDDPAWSSYVQAHYERVCTEGAVGLYIAKAILREDPP